MPGINVRRMFETATPERIHIIGASTSIKRTITPWKVNEIEVDTGVNVHYEDECISENGY